MFKPLMAALLLLLVSGALSNPGTNAAAVGSTSLWDATAKGVRAPARYYDVLHERFELDPGQWSSLRNSQAQFVLTVIEGEFTLLLGEKKEVFRAGQTATVPAGLNFRFGNESKAITRLQEAIIIPAWSIGPPTVLEPATSPVRVTSPILRGNFNAVSQSPATIDVTQQGADLRAGYESPRFTANAFNLLTVTSGELTLRYADGTVQRVASGQGGAIAVGKAVSLVNEGVSTTSYFITWITAPGATLTSATPAPAPSISPPSTGDAGLAN